MQVLLPHLMFTACTGTPPNSLLSTGNRTVGISYSPWLRNLVPDINIAYLTGYTRIDEKQVIAGSLLYSSLGIVPLTDEFGNAIRDINPNEFALDAAYSRLFSENISGSIAFRFIYSNLTGGIYSGGMKPKPGSLLLQTSPDIIKKISGMAARKDQWHSGSIFQISVQR